MVEFGFEFCNFAVEFSVYCLAFYFEFNNHKTNTQNKSCKQKTFAEKKQLEFGLLLYLD